MIDLLPWLTLFGLGAFHGLNPAMGWLFAVALGMQEQRRSAVWRALPPIALGHAVSVALVVGLVVLAKAAVSQTMVKAATATILFGFGLYRLVRSRHPNWVGMRVGFRDLSVWSFIMASAHGAGLMLIPLFLKRVQVQPAIYATHLDPGLNVEPVCTSSFATCSTPSLLASSVATHTLGHFLVTALIALSVYEKLGLALLRRAWFNLDLVWMVALMATGLCILLG